MTVNLGPLSKDKIVKVEVVLLSSLKLQMLWETPYLNFVFPEEFICLVWSKKSLKAGDSRTQIYITLWTSNFVS